ncbi:HAD family hydrolase [Yersinia intermedia]|uniref:HAD family hydrolase n=1 Tax=Yersinia intermedia TaxID=631 RepID=UPI002244A9CF|nr:HAD family phosphatase [Yersinia intermedia]MCW8113799.1 HAD family phosphatase [Yersinia intermedia]MDA5518648.1 HAD family phosphatase [Yersinia intermedia]
MATFKPHLIIFDCDGVLVDSEILGINLTLDILRRYGCQISHYDFSAAYSGMAWDNLIKKVNEDFGICIPESASYDFFDDLRKTFKLGLVRIKGTQEVISKLGYQKCICSNSSAEQVRMMLELVGLDLLFENSIFSATELGSLRCKPKPDIFLTAADYYNVSPNNAIVIEDSVPGVTAAKAAGMYTVGFIGGAHTYPQHSDRLRKAGADVIIKSMFELPALITD